MGKVQKEKELFAGLLMIQVPSRDDAIIWAVRFAGVAGDVEMNLRLLRD